MLVWGGLWYLWGMPAKTDRILELARWHELKVRGDAAHAHGATWRVGPGGALGDISVLSLPNDRLAPTDDVDDYERAVCLGDIARIRELESPTFPSGARDPRSIPGSRW
jgi:hypothetical protein